MKMYKREYNMLIQNILGREGNLENIDSSISSIVIQNNPAMGICLRIQNLKDK